MLLGGLCLLVASGEFLVRGAVYLASKMKVSSLVIGMTVVSFGTSAPELLVSLEAALNGHADICIGNIVGSNIANLALVLGLTAIVFPVVVDKNSVRVDWPLMFGATLLFVYFISDSVLSHTEGWIFVFLIVSIVLWMIWKSRKEQKGEVEVEKAESGKKEMLINISYLAGAFVGLYFGADWLVEGAVNIAEDLGVDEKLIGVTIVSFGTSLPELVTSLVAAFRKESDISIGNLIGSNLFNILAILGITAAVKEIDVSFDAFFYDVSWMVGISILVFPLMMNKMSLSRIKGFLLFACYCGFMTFTICRSVNLL